MSVSTPIARLFTKPIVLVSREDLGSEDEWGSPILTETRTDTVCYYRLMRTTDTDEDGTVVSESYDIFLPADTPITDYEAVELDGATLEVIGRPDAEWNARIGEVNHIKLRAQKGRP